MDRSTAPPPMTAQLATVRHIVSVPLNSQMASRAATTATARRNSSSRSRMGSRWMALTCCPTFFRLFQRPARTSPWFTDYALSRRI